MKLEKFNYNVGKGKRMFLYGFILAVALMILINLFFSEAKYFKTESIKLVEGTMSYKPYDFKIMAMYQENVNGNYEEIETMPTSGYVINEEKSYCTLDNINKDSNAILKTIGSNHTFSNLSKNEKCYLYFDIYVPTASNIILANKIMSTRTDFATTLTTDTTGTIYSAEDDYGTSYYFAGAPTDNWIYFGGFYWRIIRINGDGSIRMIYQGTTANTTGTGTQIGTSSFNSSANNNMYVGYMYTSGEVHGTSIASKIKGVLDNWYNSNLANYVNYIAIGNGATFCNDRQPSTSSSSLNGSGGTGTTITYYAGYIRLYNNNPPTFKCTDSRDRFDTSIGLVTADEVAYTGGVTGTDNTSYYLYTNQDYWTMSPCVRDSYGWTRVFLVFNNGRPLAGGYNVSDSKGVRPVINLKADTQFSSGDGTIKNPYIVS